MPSRLLLALGLALAAPALFAQADPPRKELTEKTSAGLSKLAPLVEAKDYAGALALVDSLAPAAPANSFDTFILSQLRAQILLTQGKLAEAITPMEASLKLGEANPQFTSQSTTLEQLYTLAQLHYQRAAEIKGAAQRAGFETALGYIQRWLRLNPRPNAEGRVFAASVLYQLGGADPAKIDAARLRAAIEQGREALLLSVNPSAQAIQILAACHVQLGENDEAAACLETLALREPRNASNWSQLFSIYMAAASDAKDPARARSLQLAALATLERAQENGQLSSPRDHYARVAVLFNIRQYGRAAALLEKGLADGSVEGSKRNWELLASAYQQIDQDAKALYALARATDRFPKDGALEFSLAQLLFNTGKTDEAYARGRSALAKGLEKPGQSQAYLAYLAFELQRYDEALKWAEAARASGDVPADTVEPIAKAASEALSARQTLKRG